MRFFLHQQKIWVALLGILVAYTPNSVLAQKMESNQKALQKQAKVYQKAANNNREKAFALARKKNWITFKKFEDGKIMSLQGLDPSGMPVYLVTDNNSFAAATTRVNKLYNNGGLGLSLSGSSAFLTNKIGIWDGGSVYADHQEFAGGRVQNKNSTAAVSEHSTHVAGTMMASGVNSVAKGMAFGLPNLVGYDFNNDETEMALEASNMLISNHSYGFIAGWYYNSSPSGGAAARWEWYGINGATEDYKFGFYDDDTRRWDEICYNAPYYLPVKSSGNNRSQNGPADGGTYYRFVSGTWTEFTRQAGEISNNNSYDIISLSGNAKNILTVGAVSGIPNGPFTQSNIQVSSFSSWGPTDDGRIKPDVVGMGVAVTSTINTNATAYGSLSGTSMAAPNVSGSLILLQEAYAQKNSGNFLRSATLKALAIHTAEDAGNTGPDYIYGWGLLNAEKAASLILDDGNKSKILQDELSQGATKTITLISSGSGPLMATICWTDPQGALNTSNTVDERAPRLVNDLDLRINGETYKPWILDPEQPSVTAIKGDNFRDNVEQVLIADPIPGKTYTLTITHKGTLTDAKQNFGLILSGIGGTAYCISAPSSNADAKITSFSLSNLLYTATPGACTAYTDNTGQLIEVEAGGTYPLNLKLGTCGANANKMAKIYIDYNGDGTFNETSELIATSPVIAGNGEFSANITIPNSVTIDNISLLRIVMSETSTASTISACNAYTKGETQDYRIKFKLPSLDAGISAIVDPVSGSCTNPAQKVTVKLKNFGSSSISNIPVIVKIRKAGNLVATLTQTYTGSISTLSETNFTLSASFNAEAGVSYEIEAASNLTNDLNAGNNTSIINASISNPPGISNASALQCGTLAQYTLNANGSGTIFWYKNASDNVPLTFSQSNVGTSYTDNGPAINKFYAGINDLSSSVGPATNTVFSSGGFLSGNNPAVLMRTAVPVTLESARLYIGAAGKITFIASKTNTGAEVSRVTLEVNPGSQVYPLNLTLPEAGDYSVAISYENGASIYRNNGGVTGYPFKIGEIFSIIGNTASTTGTTTFADFYYYFYDLKVKSAGCTGVQRIEVNTSVLTKPTITVNGILLTSSSASGNQWHLNGVAIAGATASTYTAAQGGLYSVTVSNGSCSLSSDQVNVGIIFPLPVSNFQVSTTEETCRGNDNGIINISAVQALNYTATLIKAGLVIKTETFSNTLAFNNLAAGTYNLCITVAGQTDYKQCYDLVITEPKDLAVFTQVNPVTNSVTLTLNGGSNYQVKLNDEVYQTSATQITLPLKSGDNKLSIHTEKICQGVFDETIFVNENAIIYPNPFSEILNIRLGSNQTETVKITLVKGSGLVVYTGTYNNSNGTIQLNLPELESGLYFLSIDDKTYKVIKK